MPVYRTSLLIFFYRRAFLLRFSLYNDYIANFFTMWGPFCYVFFCINYNDYIGNIFYHVEAFLLLFLNVGGFLLHFSLYWEHFLPCGGGGLSAVFFHLGDLFLVCPPPTKIPTCLLPPHTI